VSAGVTRQDELAAFLRAHPPFDSLDEEALHRVAVEAEEEVMPAGGLLFAQGTPPPEYLSVVRSGQVELVADGQVIDVLGPGALFGYASMLSGFPTGFAARAVPGATVLRMTAATARELLAAPEGLRFVARSLLEEPTELHLLAREPSRNAADQPVGTLLRGEPAVCGPATPIRDAARMMNEARATAIVVELGDGGYGILTDRDLRERVLAAGLDGAAPVSAAMSAPALTVTVDQPSGAVLLEMLDRALSHVPVIAPGGRVVGVVEEVDLVFAQTRSSFYLRQRIAAADSEEDLVTVSRELRPMVISLHDARVAAANVMAVYAVCVDALTRRLLELSLARHGGVGVEFAWLALGSQARREALPGSDVDSAIVWFGRAPGALDDENDVRRRLITVTRDVTSGLRACGLASDEHGVNADAEPFVRSVASWQAVARSWMADPTQEKALILASVLIDSRPVYGLHTGTPVTDTFALAPEHPDLLRLLARFALSHRPATRMFGGLALEQSGVNRGRVDLKRGGIVPILDLSRWGAFAAGVTAVSTTERLQAAAAAGRLEAADAHTLRDAFELLNNLRLDHQVAQLRVGRTPDDLVDPDELSPLMRAQLRGALRAVAVIQRRIAGELGVGAR
jgi:CBS domain-containing protein